MEKKAKINPLRLSVIQRYQDGEKVSSISSCFPEVSMSTIYVWIKEYQEGKLCRKPNKPRKAKEENFSRVIALHKLGLSVRAIHDEIKSVSEASIRRWIMETEPSQGSGKKDRPAAPAQRETLYDGMTAEELLVRYRELQEKNKRQKAQITLAETMIKLAEEEFGISIRKKSGAK